MVHNNFIIKNYSKTLVVHHKFSKNNKNIIKFMSKITKNIYNITIFSHLLFLRYKRSIFKDLYDYIIQNNIKIHSELIDTKLLSIFDKYYKYYIGIKNDIDSNNENIYKYIINKIHNKKIIINSNNYFEIKKMLTDKLLNIKGISFSDNTKDELFYSIIDRIIKSIYTKNFMTIKYEIFNKIPISIKDKTLIENVKNKKYLFDGSTKVIDYKLIINEIFNKNNNGKLKSDRNYVNRFIYSHLGDNEKLLHSDIVE